MKSTSYIIINRRTARPRLAGLLSRRGVMKHPRSDVALSSEGTPPCTCSRHLNHQLNNRKGRWLSTSAALEGCAYNYVCISNRSTVFSNICCLLDRGGQGRIMNEALHNWAKGPPLPPKKQKKTEKNRAKLRRGEVRHFLKVDTGASFTRTKKSSQNNGTPERATLENNNNTRGGKDR